MLTKIETQARKKAKLTPYMDVMDFQIILLTGLVAPMAVWLLTGLTWKYTIWFVVAYSLWILRFKINKPSGYAMHFWKFMIRGKAWSGYSGAEATPEMLSLRDK